jgi:hypothetical protein
VNLQGQVVVRHPITQHLRREPRVTLSPEHRDRKTAPGSGRTPPVSPARSPLFHVEHALHRGDRPARDGPPCPLVSLATGRCSRNGNAAGSASSCPRVFHVKPAEGVTGMPRP